MCQLPSLPTRVAIICQLPLSVDLIQALIVKSSVILSAGSGSEAWLFDAALKPAEAVLPAVPEGAAAWFSATPLYVAPAVSPVVSAAVVPVVSLRLHQPSGPV